MTVAQENKVLKDKLKDWNTKKSFLTSNERLEFRNKIVLMQKKLDSFDETYKELEAYRRKYRHATHLLHKQKEENKMLKNKISFLHTNYKSIIQKVSKNGR